MSAVAVLNPWPQPGIVTAAGAAGCSIVVLDAEHGVVQPEHVHTLVLEGHLCGVSLWVRVPGHEAAALAAYLDRGVDGIVVPRVSTLAQAEAIVQAVRYPPRGKRGIGPTPDNAYFLAETPARYLAAVEERVRLFVQIEDPEGVRHAADIAAVEGICGVLIGPLDLATGMGFAGRTTEPAVQEAIVQVAAAFRSCGKQVSLPVGPSGKAPVEVDVALGYLPELLHHAVRDFVSAAGA